MSLINDALRRARQAQKSPDPKTATREGPSFRAPVAPRHEPRMTWLPAFCLAAIGVTALVIAANWRAQHPSSPPLEARARTLDAPASAGQSVQPRPVETVAAVPATAAATAPAVPAVPTRSPVAALPASSAPDQYATLSPATLPTAQVSGTPVASPSETQVGSIVASASAPPSPEPKLQGIIYDPQRPSAMIDGKVLFVGDKLRDFRVLAITPTGATLVSASATNHLEL